MLDVKMLGLVASGLWETVYMTVIATFFSYVIGLPLGLVLAVTDPNGIRPNKKVNAPLGFLVNVLRSVPFIILMVAVIPFTRFVTGTSIGSVATIVPLTVAAFPLVARSVEASVSEVNRGVIEAARSMGASVMQIVCRVLLPEALPSLISGAAGATISVLGFSAMAGACGGGGLGAIAINYGYYRGETLIMWIMVVILVALVQGIQMAGAALAAANDRSLAKRSSPKKK